MSLKSSLSAARKTIKEDLLTLGLVENGRLLVHASLRSLGELPGGPEDAIASILDALGPKGTLMLPALSYATVNSGNPVFDLANTPTCVGALPEYFRKRAGTIRSVHPTHSVCGTGYDAELLLGEHHLDSTPCGKHSPFYKLNELGGQILFIGCGMNPNTSMHAIEELIEPEYLFADDIDYRIILPEKEMRMRVRRHNFKGWSQAYARLADILDGKDLKTGKVHGADCHLINVQAMWQKAYKALRADPLFFVKKIAS